MYWIGRNRRFPALALIGLSLGLACAMLAPAPAAAGRLGAWDNDAAKFLPPIAEPDTAHSHVTLDGGDQIEDFQLADALFTGDLTDKKTVIKKYGALEFVIDSCAAGGFIGDLAATDGKESSLADPKKLRPNIGVMTASSYNRCSLSGGVGKDAFSAFSKGFNVAVAAPHPADDDFLTSYKLASKIVQKGQKLDGGTIVTQSPQYYSTGDKIDAMTLTPHKGVKNYALLVVGPENKNKEPAFWNDLVELHTILVDDYGWSDKPGAMNEIIALFADGKPPDDVKDKIDWIDGIANSAAFEKELARVHDNFTDDSLGFFYFAGHGSSTEPFAVVAEPTSAALLALGALLPILATRRVRRGDHRPAPPPLHR
jgi:hypothetical protein